MMMVTAIVVVVVLGLKPAAKISLDSRFFFLLLFIDFLRREYALDIPALMTVAAATGPSDWTEGRNVSFLLSLWSLRRFWTDDLRLFYTQHESVQISLEGESCHVAVD